MLRSPKSVTILPTYQCSAACTNCCFESNPNIKHRMSFEEIVDLIDQIKRDLPLVKLIVFSGGECTLLKRDLVKALKYANNFGFLTRIVSNGHWGKTSLMADSMAHSLKEAGLNELNLSTGDEHAEYVPPDSVINAACASVKIGIRTLITIEGTKVSQLNKTSFYENTKFASLLSDTKYSRLLHIITNVWMPFDNQSSFEPLDVEKKGCENIFNNLAINPYGTVYSCCGLTMEFIDGLVIGKLNEQNVSTIYNEQYHDLLKLWIWLDGPEAIIRSVLPGSTKDFGSHACETCWHLHNESEIKSKIIEAVKLEAEDIYFRAMAKAKQQKMEVINAE